MKSGQVVPLCQAMDQFAILAGAGPCDPRRPAPNPNPNHEEFPC
jgi:hypothetical protein